MVWAHGIGLHFPSTMARYREILKCGSLSKIVELFGQHKLNMKFYFPKIRSYSYTQDCLQDLVQVTCSLYASNALEVTKITYGSVFLQQFKFKKLKDAGIQCVSFSKMCLWIWAIHQMFMVSTRMENPAAFRDRRAILTVKTISFIIITSFSLQFHKRYRNT